MELVRSPDGAASPRGAESEPDLPGPRLLGPFEPVLLGWTSREDIIGPHTGLVTTNGIFRAFAMVGGRAVATWKLSSGALTIEPLERITRADRAALDADGADVLRFLSLG